MTILSYRNCNVSALAAAVPGNVQVACTDQSHPRAKYIASFIRQIGIRERHISFTEQTALDMGYAAAREALATAGCQAGDIDGIIFLTQSPDLNPGTGNSYLLHYRLGMAMSAFAFDVTLGCSSFPYGLSIACSFLQQEQVHRLLVVAGDTKWADCESLESLSGEYCFLHGEGAVAMLLSDDSDEDVKISLHANGDGYRYLFNPAGGCRNRWRVSRGLKETGAGVPIGQHMDGLEVTSFSTVTVSDSIKEFMGELSTSPDDYDALVLHQANKQIVSTIAKRTGFPMEKVPMSLDRYANTDGASLPLTICDAFNRDLAPGRSMKLLCSAFGTGLSWGICSLSIKTDVVSPIVNVDDEYFSELDLTN